MIGGNFCVGNNRVVEGYVNLRAGSEASLGREVTQREDWCGLGRKAGKSISAKMVYMQVKLRSRAGSCGIWDASYCIDHGATNN